MGGWQEGQKELIVFCFLCLTGQWAHSFLHAASTQPTTPGPAQSILDLPATEMVRAACYRLTPSALHISPRHSVWKMLQSILRIKAKSRKVKSFMQDRAGINTHGNSVSLLRLLP